MISLDFYLSTHSYPSNFSELDVLLQGATAQVTFWGGRSFRVNGYEYSGSVAIDAVANRVLRAAHGKVTSAQKLLGRKILDNLKKLYDDTDTLLGNSNPLTRLCAATRRSTSTGYTPRFFIEEYGADNFQTVDAAKQLEMFN